MGAGDLDVVLEIGASLVQRRLQEGTVDGQDRASSAGAAVEADERVTEVCHLYVTPLLAGYAATGPRRRIGLSQALASTAAANRRACVSSFSATPGACRVALIVR